jgi:hypothetical protein
MQKASQTVRAVLGLQESRPGRYVSGDTLNHGDLAVFVRLSTLQSGWLEG